MDVRNCKNCGKLFNYTGEPICPVCAKELEDKFFSVRDFIYANPTASMSTVAEEMEIPIQQIKKWVRQERLSFSKDSGMSIDCEVCGKPILTGRYCKECKMQMTNKLSGMYSHEEKHSSKQTKVSSNGKMRFLGN